MLYKTYSQSLPCDWLCKVGCWWYWDDLTMCWVAVLVSWEGALLLRCEACWEEALLFRCEACCGDSLGSKWKGYWGGRLSKGAVGRLCMEEGCVGWRLDALAVQDDVEGMLGRLDLGLLERFGWLDVGLLEKFGMLDKGLLGRVGMLDL